jgi:hypothetical protein
MGLWCCLVRGSSAVREEVLEIRRVGESVDWPLRPLADEGVGVLIGAGRKEKTSSEAQWGLRVYNI